ncbi:oxidoreductase [Ensifer sp. 22564]|uniref:oxidoreductase n=1 Tax=Ensifer sp. 22564 TaxID=3453943 RepID=UPI003F834362
MPTTLFSPVSLGSLTLPNRIALAPMTRARCNQPGNVPNTLMAEYYARRALASTQGQGSFIANLDLPRRLKEGLPLATFDRTKLFGGSADGYSTYPALEDAA